MNDDRAREFDLLRDRLLGLRRRPRTGEIEMTTGPAVSGTLVLDGRTLRRLAFPDLWRWAGERDLVRDGLFGPGDGATTFTLPDFRARFGDTPVSWLIHT